MTLEELASKYEREEPPIIWETAALEVCPHDPVYHMNLHGAEGWEPLRPVGRGKKAWLFKRPIRHDA